MTLTATIDTYLEDRLDDYIHETAELCVQPSVSAQGEGMRECATLVTQILARHGYEVQMYETPGEPVIVGRLPGKSERTLLFYNHYDVQPPEPLEMWDSPPFEPTIRDGALYARGSKDDKGELIARLAAVDAVRAAHGGELPCGILFVIEGQEEIGSPHIAEFVQEHRNILRCHGSIWEEGGIDIDGRTQNMLGARGILAVEMTVETMNRDTHSGSAHIFPNAVWRLVWALQSLKNKDERLLIDGWYDDAHPPSERDLEYLEQMPLMEATYRETVGVKRFAAGRTGDELRRTVFEPTCNIQGIDGGYQGEGSKTITPARARAKLDFRLVPDQDPRRCFDLLRAHLDAHGFEDIELAWLGAMSPSRTDPDDPLVRLTNDAALDVYGKPASVVPLNGGSSPQYAFKDPLGIPIVRAGVGYWDSRTHAPNEHVRLEDFLKAAKHIARIVEGFADL